MTAGIGGGLLALWAGVAQAGELVVLREAGVFAIDSAHGKTLRQLAKGRFDWGRRIGASVVVFREQDGTLWRIDNGASTQIARLPTAVKDCALSTGPSQLTLQSSQDVVLDATGEALCVQLADRNDNMREIAASYRVELKSGRVSAALIEHPGCKPASPKAVCTPASTKPPAHARGSYPTRYDPKTGMIHGPGVRTTQLPKSADQGPPIRATTEDGRYLLLAMPTSQGDYMHAALIGLDLQHGTAHRITGKAWHPAATASDLVAWAANPEAIEALDVVGESTLKALPGQAGFYVDGVLIWPTQPPKVVGTVVW